MDQIFEELRVLWSSINADQLRKIVREIASCEGKIFCLGAGRMGYSIQSFAMRLSHLGFPAYMIGDTTLPRIEKGDLILINSSSGETPTIVLLTKIAKKYGGRVIVISSNEGSTLSKLADLRVIYKQIGSKQLMKTAYEQFSFLLFDKMAFDIFQISGRSLDFVENNHSILE